MRVSWLRNELRLILNRKDSNAPDKTWHRIAAHVAALPWQAYEPSMLSSVNPGRRILASWKGFTLQVYVDDMKRARPWYEQLFRRKPDYFASPEFLEWEIFPDFWFQVVKKEGQKDPQRKRFGVSDIDRERRRIIEEMKVAVTEVEELPKGVVKWCNFEDPWGNKLGLFQDLEKYPPTKSPR